MKESLFYSTAQLSSGQLQSFSGTNRSAFRQFLRLSMIIFLALDVIFVLQSFGSYRLLRFFTNWTLCATLIMLCLSLILHATEEKSHYILLLGLHHFLFEITSIMNLITTSVYWSLLHEETMLTPEYRDFPDRQVHTYFVHLVPLLFFVLNFLISDVVMKARHILLFMPLLVVYVYMNYLDTIKSGEVLYSIFDWINDFQGAVRNLALMIIAFVLKFIGMAKLT